MSSQCEYPRIGKPCPSCPWRKDQDGRSIPNFDLALAERLAATSPDERGHGPSFFDPMFACHQSKENLEFACAGWLATVGHAHPAVRLSVSQGQLPVSALKPGTDWPELHDSYGEVLEKLRASFAEVEQ